MVVSFDNTTIYVPMNRSAVIPIGIAAVAMDDVWVATNDPSVFYHFDGFKWMYENYLFSKYLSIVISFGNVTTFEELHDVSMSDGYAGYVVGDSGLIIKYYSHVDTKLDTIFMNLSAQFAALNISGNIGNFSGNVSVDLTQLTQAIQNMNTSILSAVAGIDATLNQMNVSIQNKLESISSNVTYANLYMETTMFPLLNSTYVGVQQILVNLGILQATANQTLIISNQTLQLVNQTDQKVDVLINRSNRVKAWTTQ
jgi:hypothetical protein